MQSFFNKVMKWLLVLTIIMQGIAYANIDDTEENQLITMKTDSPIGDFSWSEEGLKEVEKIIKSCGSGVSVFYKDIQSGYTYTYNENQKYFIASIIKAPYCMYVYDLASQGKCDLNKVYTYAARHKTDGTGKIQEMKIGTTFTLRQLLEYAIKYSDNVAMSIIRENFPVHGYKEYAKKLGLKHPEDIKYATNGDLLVSEAGVYIEAIYNFIKTNSYGAELRKLMLSTTNPMIVSKYPVVRKYGWADQSFHDMAIVEAPRPYLLCILTNHDGDFASFKKISQVIEKQVLNNNLEATPSPYEINVNKEKKDIVGYDIEGSTYLSIREVARAINDTASRFSVIWDESKQAIVMNLGETYKSSEEIMHHKTSQQAIATQSKVYINGEEIMLPTYKINGITYFKLRDLGDLLRIQINWIKQENCISIIG